MQCSFNIWLTRTQTHAYARTYNPVTTMTDVSAKLAKIFVDLETNSKQMITDGTTIRNSASACGGSAAQYTAAVGTFATNVNSMQAEWAGSGVNMQSLADRISGDGSHYVNLYVRLLVGLMLIPTGSAHEVNPMSSSSSSQYDY